MNPHICPFCGVSFKGADIPDNAIEKGFYQPKCPSCGDRNHWLNLWVLERAGGGDAGDLYEVMCQRCGNTSFMSGEHVNRNKERE